jgi:hypothetical protein
VRQVVVEHTVDHIAFKRRETGDLSVAAHGARADKRERCEGGRTCGRCRR